MAAKKSAAQRQGQTVQEYHSVFNTAQGTNVLHDMMMAHNMFNTTYTKDVHEALIREGERRVILRILNLLKTNPRELMERIRNYEQEME